MSQKAFSCYRALLRARTGAFKEDNRALVAARDEIRKYFEDSRHETDPEAVAKKLEEGREAAEFLRQFVVQARTNDEGNFTMQLDQRHAGMEAEVPGTDGGCSNTKKR